MALIPLTVDDPNPTVIDNKNHIKEAVIENGQAVYITPLDRGQLTDQKRANTTYDVRVGARYRDHREAGATDLPPGGTIPLSPGNAVIIETEEWVHFPRCMFGYLIPKVSLLEQGISNTSSKVDPGYNGHMDVTVFNLGKKLVTLSRGQPFCALAIHRVEDGARLYSGAGKQLPGKAPQGRWNSFRDWVDRNNTYLFLLLALPLINFLISVIRNLPEVGRFLVNLGGWPR